MSLKRPFLCSVVLLSLASASAGAAAGPHLMPWRDPSSAAPVAAPSNAHLTYYGGRILDQVKVYSVNWGSSVSSTVQSRIGDFYGAFTGSPMFDWLTEYNTPASGGTNQTLKHGSFGGTITITPSNTATSLTDDQIKAELKAQIAAGKLPKADGNTLLMINFPPGVKISIQGTGSCVSGGFCAYHNTIAASDLGSSFDGYYGVLPDESAGSGCDLGCGNAGNMFDNYTSVASHELIEAVTDPGVGLATSYGPPLGWYDQNNGEIGDICNALQSKFAASNGTTYTVQNEWSNSVGNCIGMTADNFSLSISPSTQGLQAGSSASYSVTSAVTRGAAQSVQLSVSGLPSGVSGSFSPSTITAGQSSTLTLSAASSSVNGTVTFSVKGTGSIATHTASATVTVSGGSSSGCPAGTHQGPGGTCIPDGNGCNTTGLGSGAAWAGALALGALMLLRRRRAA